MQSSRKAVIVKKYSNRRLYDTDESRYITLDELSEKIKRGDDVRVVDAKTNDDLTQSTLAQIILESRRAAHLLPTPLLMRLIRMDDDALAEFFSGYMSWALELYMQAKSGAEAMARFNPFATLPFTATSAMARLFSSGNQQTANPSGVVDVEPEPEPVDKNGQSGELAELRKEIEALKEVLAKK